MDQSIFQILDDRFRVALEVNTDINEVKILHQLLMAEREFELELFKAQTAAKKEKAPSGSFSVREYTEVIDCMFGKEAR